MPGAIVSGSSGHRGGQEGGARGGRGQGRQDPERDRRADAPGDDASAEPPMGRRRRPEIPGRVREPVDPGPRGRGAATRREPGIYGVVEVRSPAVFVVPVTEAGEIVLVVGRPIHARRSARWRCRPVAPQLRGTAWRPRVLAASAELREETGLAADDWQRPRPGLLAERRCRRARAGVPRHRPPSGAGGDGAAVRGHHGISYGGRRRPAALVAAGRSPTTSRWRAVARPGRTSAGCTETPPRRAPRSQLPEELR